MNTEQANKMRTGKGFIAALDQSGGSTPKALRLYGIEESEYSGDAQMFDLIHGMRTRMIKSPAFNGDRVLGAILFEGTMDRDIDGIGSAEYLWTKKGVIPFLKVDKGLADEANGVQVMKPMPELDALLKRAVAKGIFGTKMRSVIKLANKAGIDAVVKQQFEVGRQILAAGLVPIIEPEVDINSPEKAAAEDLLKAAIAAELAAQPADKPIMLKLTLPSTDNFYADFVKHASVLRVVALSGGYSREDANAKLSRNNGMIASFSRALTEGLSAKQSEAEFNAMLDSTIAGIYAAGGDLCAVADRLCELHLVAGSDFGLRQSDRRDATRRAVDQVATGALEHGRQLNRVVDGPTAVDVVGARQTNEHRHAFADLAANGSHGVEDETSPILEGAAVVIGSCIRQW
ncbi:MAG: fructose bisphosphate aldolase [Actinobacteria bacterium]|nr:fructose bisphosphate aldolase [Actinomycetota bacterium]